MPQAPWKIRISADGNGTLAAVHTTIELVNRAFLLDGLVGFDGGYAGVAVDAVSFFSIDISNPSSARLLNIVYGPSGEDGWYGYDGQAASQNAGRPDRWLGAIATEDWDTSETYRLELYLVDNAGTIIDSSFPISVGFFANTMPFSTKVYRWGDDNLVLFSGYDSLSESDATFGMVVSTDGDGITAGNAQLIVSNTMPHYQFAEVSDTQGAVCVKNRDSVNAQIVNVTRSGLTMSVGAGSSFDSEDGFINGMAHHAGGVYVVGHERYSGVGDGYRVTAVSPGSGVVAALVLPSAGGSPYLNHTRGNYTGDHTVRHADGYATVTTDIGGTYADVFQFDGSSFTSTRTVTGVAPTIFGRESLRTVRLPSGWLTVWHDRYLLWAPDFTSVLAQGDFAGIRTFFLPTQLPDVYGLSPEG